jgi:hypothetical protein
MLKYLLYDYILGKRSQNNKLSICELDIEVTITGSDILLK